MAAVSFDFNKIERRSMPIKLKDGRELVLKMPSKKIFEKISAIQKMDTDAMTGEDALDTVNAICAEIFSNNLASTEISAEEVAKSYEVEEQQVFLEAYMDFAKGATNDPN
jgi:hypothetical protein